MKRLIALLLAALMLMSGAMAETAEVLEAPALDAQTHTIQTEVYPLYYNSPQPFFGQPRISLVDGVPDLPYMDVQNCMRIVNGVMLFTEGRLYGKLKMEAQVDEENQVVIITRENGEMMICDFKNKIITWNDFYAFYMDCFGSYMDQTGLSPSMGVLKRVRSRDRYGEVTVLDLGKYNIPMIAQDGLYLVPLQTLSTFFIRPFTGCDAYFNQEALILSVGDTMKNPLEYLMMKFRQAGLVTDEVRWVASQMDTEAEAYAFVMQTILETEEGQQIREQVQEEYDNSLYKVYAGTSPKGDRSQELCEYGYCELVMELDMLYGLKEAHDIDSFNLFFAQTGLNEKLLDPNPAVADQAIYDLTAYWLDDLHSAANGRSYLSDPTSDPMSGEDGITGASFTAFRDRLMAIRDEYPEAKEPYFECGDTAYVTFDEFTNNPGRDYVGEAKAGTLTDIGEDNVSLIHYAHEQITREGSPIRNVVLDLSANTGGMVIDALYVLGWFLGDAQLSVYNTFARSAVTTTYRADVNLDGEYDDRDTISDLNLYCLISPFSFSCGNLVPWAFKEDGRVCLLGQMSGGGSCIVGHTCTAWGTIYQISSPFRLSFQKNGAYYDLDQGVEPHVTITRYEHYYDREALTEFIHNLF